MFSSREGQSSRANESGNYDHRLIKLASGFNLIFRPTDNLVFENELRVITSTSLNEVELLNSSQLSYYLQDWIALAFQNKYQVDPYAKSSGIDEKNNIYSFFLTLNTEI